MLRYLAIPFILMAIFTTGCQTSMLKQFGEVKPGMEKDDVLNLMGSPDRSERFHGKDRWTYIFYDDRLRFEKEVQFFEGNAIYVGDISKPEADKTAVAMDQRNEAKNQEIDAQIAKDVEEHRKAYLEFESKAKGTDKVRYVPQFEPIR